jgi:hypothetical protein
MIIYINPYVKQRDYIYTAVKFLPTLHIYFIQDISLQLHISWYTEEVHFYFPLQDLNQTQTNIKSIKHVEGNMHFESTNKPFQNSSIPVHPSYGQI